MPSHVAPALTFNRRTQAVQRAVDILKLFSLAEPELSLRNISVRLQLPAPTAHRLIQTLEDEGLLSRVKNTDLYRLGPLLGTLGAQMMAQYPVRRIAAPHLRRLAHELEQTVALSCYDDGFVVFLDCVEGPQAVVVMVRSGLRVPAHCVASGRAMLAHMGESEVERLLTDGLEPCRPGAVKRPEELREELAHVRERGYAVGGEWIEGLRSGAAAILDAEGRPVGALTCIGFASEVSPQWAHEIALAVRESALEISSELGSSFR